MDEFCRVTVAAITPGVSYEESWVSADLASRREWITDNCSVQWATCEGDVVGFLAYRVMQLAGRPTVHLVVASVLPEYQGKGVAFAINARIVLRNLVATRFASLVVVAHILNPIAMMGWWSRVDDQSGFYPQITAERPPPLLRRVAEEFAADVDEGFDFNPDTGVVTGRHPSGPRQLRESGHPGIDSLYRDNLCLYEGDTVVTVIDVSRRRVVAEFGELLRAIYRSATVALHPARRSKTKQVAERSRR